VWIYLANIYRRTFRVMMTRAIKKLSINRGWFLSTKWELLWAKKQKRLGAFKSTLALSWRKFKRLGTDYIDSLHSQQTTNAVEEIIKNIKTAVWSGKKWVFETCMTVWAWLILSAIIWSLLRYNKLFLGS
jgi:aryl-alcohol dehydrogenase-like predicted oxidoreductase